MKMWKPVEPTGEQCEQHTKVFENEMFVYFALWYPQMGGYSGKAILEIDKRAGTDQCSEVFIWHDGTFSFDDRSPTQMHHCCCGQFVDFGETCENLIEQSTTLRPQPPEAESPEPKAPRH